MIKYCLDRWERNKGFLEEALRTGTGFNSCSYDDLIKLVVNCILNSEDDRWDAEEITTIDNGDYQGTLLFLIPANTYQPCEYEYLMTFVGYGSCSGCDLLQSIQNNWSHERLTYEQIKDFMMLCKGLVENMIKPYNCGWRNEEEFNEVVIPEGEQQ